MRIPEGMQAALVYIEQNLKTEITADELARMAGYSTYHYYRIFAAVTGSSIAEYILRRRLDHALAEIAGGQKAVDVVPAYGFATYAGFYKSFVKLYGCSPKQYLRIYPTQERRQPEVVRLYTEKELWEILKHWEIGKAPIGTIYRMNGTKAADNVWTIGREYVLKTGDRGELLRNNKVAKALHGQGFTAAVPVLTLDGCELWEGMEPFVLTRTVQGEPLPKPERLGENRIDIGIKYGRGIARLHRALHSIQKEIVPDETDLYRNVMEWALPNVRQQNEQWGLGISENFFADYRDTFGSLAHKLPRQLIHRDPNPGNILFRNGEVSGFIDFDLSEINVRLWDICYCATGILSETDEENTEIWLELLGGIVYGYDAENKLTAAEKQAIYYVLCSIQMICVAWFESHDALTTLAKTNRRMLRQIIRHQAEIQAIV